MEKLTLGHIFIYETSCMAVRRPIVSRFGDALAFVFTVAIGIAMGCILSVQILAVEGLWLLGSALVGTMIVYGNAESWSLADHPEQWPTPDRALVVGSLLYLIGLGIRLWLGRNRN